MSVEWKDSYKIGDAEIDAQHQYLFGLINKLIAANNVTDIRALMMLMYKHTREHFVLEEGLMKKRGIPGLDAHIEQHNVILGRLNELSMDVGKGFMNKRAIADLMTDWAMRHVVLEDGALALAVTDNT